MKKILVLLFLITGFIVPDSTTAQCTHTINLYDSWGDGWNGGSCDVYVNGVLVLNDISLATGSGPGTFTFTASAGNTIFVDWTGGSYPEENYFDVLDGGGSLIVNDWYPYTSGDWTGTAVCPANPCTSVTNIGGCGSGFSQSFSGGGAGMWNSSFCGFSTPGLEKVYSFTAPSTGTYSIQVTAASGYMDYGWRAATCSSAGWTCIDDITATGVYGSMAWTAGTTYYILLDDENSTVGTHTFYINCPAADPCSAVTNIAGCGSGFAQTYTGGGSGVWSSSFCGFATPGIEKVYSFTAPTTGTYSLQVTAASGYVDYGWRAATCSSAGWTCIDDITATGVYGSMAWTAGTTYYILLDDENSTTGTHTFYINCPSAGPCTSITTIAGCGIGNTQTFNASGTGIWNPPATSCGFSTPGIEAVYQFTPSTSGTYSFIVTSASGGYVDYFYKAASGGCSNSGWTCIDDINMTGTYGSLSLTAGTTYYFLLDPEATTAVNQQFYLSCPVAPGACISTDFWLTGDAPTDNIPVQISSCNYAGEYNEVTNVMAGQTYSFSSTVGTDWLVITNTANTVLASGTTPVVWSATFTGTVRVHIFTNSSCGTESVCREQWVTCTSCFGIPPATYYTHPTLGLQDTYLGDCMVNLNCGTTMQYYDDGGPSGNYSLSVNNIYRTFCPNVTGQCVRATMVAMDIEDDGFGFCYDFLNVGNGPTQGVPTIWEGCGTVGSPVTEGGFWNGGVWTSTDASGCLSFRFYADGFSSFSGWNITLSCVPCAQANYQPSSECQGSIPCCGDASYAGASTGPGLTSTCNGCVVSENYTTWYYFEIASDGTLHMELTPNDLVTPDDYDFALFRSNDCSNLGSPVRCTYAWNTYYWLNDTGPYTGMLFTNTYTGAGVFDNTEDVNGDGFVLPLDVTAGQTYFLMVNGWTPSDQGFNLNFSFTNGATFTPCGSLPPLPVEFVNLEAGCEDGHGLLKWSTASETNNDYFEVMKSYNGFMFKTIGWVMGQGNSNHIQNYTFLDEEANEGLVYYQLKQVDLDGNSTYSPMVNTDCSQDNASDPFFVINDPESNEVIIVFNDGLPADYSILFTDPLGRKLASRSINTGVYNKLSFPKSDLAPGVYYIAVSNGDRLYTKAIAITTR